MPLVESMLEKGGTPSRSFDGEVLRLVALLLTSDPVPTDARRVAFALLEAVQSGRAEGFELLDTIHLALTAGRSVSATSADLIIQLISKLGCGPAADAALDNADDGAALDDADAGVVFYDGADVVLCDANVVLDGADDADVVLDGADDARSESDDEAVAEEAVYEAQVAQDEADAEEALYAAELALDAAAVAAVLDDIDIGETTESDWWDIGSEPDDDTTEEVTEMGDGWWATRLQRPQ